MLADFAAFPNCLAALLLVRVVGWRVAANW
jgi:hypothetical protein